MFVFSFANSQIVNIPDANLKTKLLLANNTSGHQIAKNLNGDYFKIDSNNDGEIQFSEALQVLTLDTNFGSNPVS